MVAYEGNEPFVFISYAHKDKNLVLPIIRGLQEKGFRVWYDEGIEVGNEWPDFIAEHLENCECVLSFVSRNFGDSQNCRQEFTFSQNLRKDNSVVYLEDPQMLRAGLRMQLSNLHALYYQKNDTTEELLKELSSAKVLKPCLGGAAASKIFAESQKKEQNNQDESLEKEKEVVAGTLSELASQKYGESGTSVAAKTSETAPAKFPELSLEEAYRQAMVYYDQGEYKKAFSMFQNIAEQGHAAAQNALAKCYYSGFGIHKNYEKTVMWFRKSAEQGYAAAQYNLGLCYENGQGVLRNYEEAVKWYQKAANQGEASAQNNLGYCYENGIGVTQDYEMAVKWYRKATNQNNASAQYNMGDCYYYGHGVQQNYEEAKHWYQMAADQGHEDAIQMTKKCRMMVFFGKR